MANTTLHALSQETNSGQSSYIASPANSLIGMFVNISSVSGVLPTLTVQLQESPNGTDWYNVAGINITSISSTGLIPVMASTGQLIADFVRITWTIAGVGASFTFSVDLETL